MPDYGSYSLWLDQVRDDLVPRPPLASETDADVAIVGAGYTGLWTAYYLLRRNEGLRVALVEREIAGFGASGRNGGWCSALFAASHDRIARRYGREAAVAMRRALCATVDEVGRVTFEEGIDADFHKGGTLSIATSPAHVPRLRSAFEREAAWGFGPPDHEWLSADDAARRVRVARCEGALHTPHCARLHPAKLARGLALTITRRGGVIYERTPALAIEPGRVITSGGVVRADAIIRATEAYTSVFPRLKRKLVPLYSLMVATEPLPTAVWDEIGWTGAETLTDGRNLLIYAQRTADDRIAMGGRGAPYHFASRIEDRFDRDDSVFSALGATIRELFPPAADARITHAWGGPLGAPRDWFSAVVFDFKTRVGWAGGYVGDGVATSNLAGRTLADLVLGERSELTDLPWVGHRSRRWEPEPFRWIGVNLALKLLARADHKEEQSLTPARLGRLTRRVLGL